MSFPIAKPDWKNFQDHLIATINSYRHWQIQLTKCGTDQENYSRNDCKENIDQFYRFLCGHRTTLNLLYPKDPRVQRLNGFILFAGESATNSEEFLNNIRAEIKDLIEERL